MSSFLKLYKSNISKKAFKPKITLNKNNILNPGILYFQLFGILFFCKFDIAQQRIVGYLLLFWETNEQRNTSNVYTAEILTEVNVF